MEMTDKRANIWQIMEQELIEKDYTYKAFTYFSLRATVIIKL